MMIEGLYFDSPTGAKISFVVHLNSVILDRNELII